MIRPMQRTEVLHLNNSTARPFGGGNKKRLELECLHCAQSCRWTCGTQSSISLRTSAYLIADLPLRHCPKARGTLQPSKVSNISIRRCGTSWTVPPEVSQWQRLSEKDLRTRVQNQPNSYPSPSFCREVDTPHWSPRRVKGRIFIVHIYLSNHARG